MMDIWGRIAHFKSVRQQGDSVVEKPRQGVIFQQDCSLLKLYQLPKEYHELGSGSSKQEPVGDILDPRPQSFISISQGKFI